jgi:hypothetical protein
MVAAGTLRTLCKNRKECGTRKGRVKDKINCYVNYRSGIIPFRDASGQITERNPLPFPHRPGGADLDLTLGAKGGPPARVAFRSRVLVRLPFLALISRILGTYSISLTISVWESPTTAM